MKEIKQYDPKNRLNALYKAGKMQHYEQNLCSVMCEKIKSNCEIATELAWRDWQIEQFQARIKELESEKRVNEIKAQGIADYLENDLLQYVNSYDVNYGVSVDHIESEIKKLRAKNENND